jgi:hypothetical protein
VWYDIGNGENAPSSKLPTRLRQGAQYEGAVEFMQSSHHSGQE